MMRFFVVAVVFAIVCGALAVTDEQKQIAEKHVKECAVETSFTADDLAKLRTNPKAAVGDAKAQKFGKCFLHKLGFINDAGDLQEQVVIEKLSKGGDRAKIEEIVKQCKSVIGANKDENPIKLYGCYLEKKALVA